MTYAFRIRDWAKYYEKSDLKKTLNWKWIGIPIKHDGKSFRRLMKRDPAAFGPWVLLLQVSAKCPTRGTLIEEDGPLTPSDLELKTGMPEHLFKLALKICYEIGWLELSEDGGILWKTYPDAIPRFPDDPDHPDGIRTASGRHPDKNDINRHINIQMEPIRTASGRHPDHSETSGLQDRTVQDTTVHQTTFPESDVRPEISGQHPDESIPDLFPDDTDLPESKPKSKVKATAKDKRSETGWGIWVDKHREAGIPDPLPLGPDLAAAKQIFEHFKDPAMIIDMYGWYLQDKDEFIENNGHPLRFFMQRSGKYAKRWGEKIKRQREVSESYKQRRAAGERLAIDQPGNNGHE